MFLDRPRKRSLEAVLDSRFDNRRRQCHAKYLVSVPDGYVRRCLCKDFSPGRTSNRFHISVIFWRVVIQKSSFFEDRQRPLLNQSVPLFILSWRANSIFWRPVPSLVEICRFRITEIIDFHLSNFESRAIPFLVGTCGVAPGVFYPLRCPVLTVNVCICR
jgi:hypothetical protein